jgi:hypothetical protein
LTELVGLLEERPNGLRPRFIRPSPRVVTLIYAGKH